VSDISRIIPDLQSAGEGLKWIQDNLFNGLRGGPVDVTLGRPKRTKDQNSKLWPMCQDVSEQVDWYGEKPDKEEWKNIFSAAWKQQKVTPGINGGFVVLPVSTKKMEVPEFSELIEIIYAFGAEHSVMWSDPALKAFEEYREGK
jgi:NAD-dependent SIR2 family protein deacetylase